MSEVWNVVEGFNVADSNGKMVCLAAEERDIPEAKSQARLIAAAPELLEALDALTLVVGLTAFKYESQRATLQEAVDRARQVIKKAREV